MKVDKIDAIVLSCGLLFGLLFIGMLTDVWQLAFYPIPLLAMVLIALGSLNKANKWGGALLPLVVYGLILVALFAWMGVTMFDDSRLGGMQTPLGILYYVIWPFITIFSGLLYALVYSTWLKRDINPRRIGQQG